MRIRTLRFYLLLFIPVLYSCTYTENKPEQMRLKIGDSIAWAAKNINEEKWEETNGINSHEVFWLRDHFTFDSVLIKESPLALHIVALGSFEVWWDGHLIGKNGKVGPGKTEEQPGKHSSYYLLPDSLSGPGKHVLAMRISNFYSIANRSFYNVRVANYVSILRFPLLYSSFMYMLTGVFLIVSVYYFFLYTANPKEQSFLIFALICTLFLLLIVVEYIPVVWSYRYDVQTIRLEIIGVLSFCVAFLIPLFLYKQFFSWGVLPLSLLWGVVLLDLYVYFHGRYDFTEQLLITCMWAGSLLLTTLALIRKKVGSGPVFAALFLSGLLGCWLYFDYTLFLSFGLVILSMLYLLVLRSKAIDRAYQAALVHSERLKIDLLRKNIQPHFLMNTITSVIDWVEESPKKGIEFIEALALELDILGQIAEQKLIPLEQEIALCKSHLKVMQFRKEIHYTWEDQGIEKGDTIPPAILHTLVENGITHSTPLTDGTLAFSLRFEKNQEGKVYELFTRAKIRKRTKEREGTGLQYVRARLTESYEQQWKLESDARSGGWMTRITIYKK